jgi:hypothetical protein
MVHLKTPLRLSIDLMLIMTHLMIFLIGLVIVRRMMRYLLISHIFEKHTIGIVS